MISVRYYDIGSVGVVGEDNEIFLRGKTITKGYYKKAEATAAAIDSDGWFHTGDAGYFKNGQLFLTERIKDLFKTSNGKYISIPFSFAYSFTYPYTGTIKAETNLR